MYHFTFWLICRLRFQRFCFLSFGTRIRTFRFQFLPHIITGALTSSILDGRNSNITGIGMSQTVFTRTLKFVSRIWITRWIWLDMKRTTTLDHEWPRMTTIITRVDRGRAEFTTKYHANGLAKNHFILSCGNFERSFVSISYLSNVTNLERNYFDPKNASVDFVIFKLSNRFIPIYTRLKVKMIC